MEIHFFCYQMKHTCTMLHVQQISVVTVSHWPKSVDFGLVWGKNRGFNFLPVP